MIFLIKGIDAYYIMIEVIGSNNKIGSHQESYSLLLIHQAL